MHWDLVILGLKSNVFFKYNDWNGKHVIFLIDVAKRETLSFKYVTRSQCTIFVCFTNFKNSLILFLNFFYLLIVNIYDFSLVVKLHLKHYCTYLALLTYTYSCLFKISIIILIKFPLFNFFICITCNDS